MHESDVNNKENLDRQAAKQRRLNNFVQLLPNLRTAGKLD
jgi:hypothetical protein